MSLNIEKKFIEDSGVWEVTLSGELDVSKKDLVNIHFSEMIEKGGNINFDIADLVYLDSTGLGTFVNLYKKIIKLDRKLTYRGIRPNIVKLIKLTGLEEIFQLEASN